MNPTNNEENNNINNNPYASAWDKENTTPVVNSSPEQVVPVQPIAVEQQPVQANVPVQETPVQPIEAQQQVPVQQPVQSVEVQQQTPVQPQVPVVEEPKVTINELNSSISTETPVDGGNSEPPKTEEIVYQPIKKWKVVMLVIFFVAILGYIWFLPEIKVMVSDWQSEQSKNNEPGIIATPTPTSNSKIITLKEISEKFNKNVSKQNEDFEKFNFNVLSKVENNKLIITYKSGETNVDYVFTLYDNNLTFLFDDYSMDLYAHSTIADIVEIISEYYGRKNGEAMGVMATDKVNEYTIDKGYSIKINEKDKAAGQISLSKPIELLDMSKESIKISKFNEMKDLIDEFDVCHFSYGNISFDKVNYDHVDSTSEFVIGERFDYTNAIYDTINNFILFYYGEEEYNTFKQNFTRLESTKFSKYEIKINYVDDSFNNKTDTDFNATYKYVKITISK